MGDGHFMDDIRRRLAFDAEYQYPDDDADADSWMDYFRKMWYPAPEAEDEAEAEVQKQRDRRNRLGLPPTATDSECDEVEREKREIMIEGARAMALGGPAAGGGRTKKKNRSKKRTKKRTKKRSKKRTKKKR